MKLLPFEPQPIEALRARFHKAINHNADLDGAPMGCIRTYLFDFEDGLTMVVSKNIIRGLSTVHASGSAMHEPMKSIPPLAMRSAVRTHLRQLWPDWNGMFTNEFTMPSGSYHFDVIGMWVN